MNQRRTHEAALALGDVPTAEECAIRCLIERWACERPEKTFVRFSDAEEWTYRDLHNRVRWAAYGLRELGVSAGDNVLGWLPNGPCALAAWFACSYLGAVWTPINVALRGRGLAHVIEDSNASVLFLASDLLEHLPQNLCALKTLIIAGDMKHPEREGCRVCHASEIFAERVEAATLDFGAEGVAPWDPCTIIYTSGTSGAAKGVICSYTQYYSHRDAWAFFGADDRMLVSLPMFHIGGTAPIYLSLQCGASIALAKPFHAHTFWADAAASQATMTILLGSMANILFKQPASPHDQAHSIKHVGMVPLVQDLGAFTQRFATKVFTWFSMTEVSVPIVSDFNPKQVGACGKVRAGYEAQIVDSHDQRLPVGETGELVLRSDRPWALNSGYWRNPAATAEAWRNAWFHTGDAFRQDDEGNFYFVDRLKDVIRRRGENISSSEVETELLSCPLIAEAAVVGVAAESGDQEVLAIIVPAAGAVLDLPALVDYLSPRIAHFMVPRYFRLVPEMAKTETQKILKRELRQVGVTADTWDRVNAGYALRRPELRA